MSAFDPSISSINSTKVFFATGTPLYSVTGQVSRRPDRRSDSVASRRLVVVQSTRLWTEFRVVQQCAVGSGTSAVPVPRRARSPVDPKASPADAPGRHRGRRRRTGLVYPGRGTRHCAGNTVGSTAEPQPRRGRRHGLLRDRRDRLHRAVPDRRAAQARGHDLRAVPGQLAGQAGRAARPARHRRQAASSPSSATCPRSGSASTPTRSSGSTARSSTSSTSPRSTTSPPTRDSQRVANVEGTRHAVQLAEAVHAGHFHLVSSIAAAGLYRGTFTEDMFDEADDVEHNPYYLDQARVRGGRPQRVPRAVAGLPARRSSSVIPRPARSTRSTARTTSSAPSSGCAALCRRGSAASASRAARSTSCRSTSSPRRWTTSPTSPASTGRRSTSPTPSR